MEKGDQLEKVAKPYRSVHHVMNPNQYPLPLSGLNLCHDTGIWW